MSGLYERIVAQTELLGLTGKELGEMLTPAVGKSGVNHRLRKICEIADDLRES